MTSTIPAPTGDTAEMYLDLLKKTLTRSLNPERYEAINPERSKQGLRLAMFKALNGFLTRRGFVIVRNKPADVSIRNQGLDWPAEGETMIGMARLESLRQCIQHIIRFSIPGDLIETGVWRGGASIFMKACLKAYGDDSRVLFCADSFAGLPQAEHDIDKADLVIWSECKALAVSVEEVRGNFAKYGLLDGNVRFIKGWFKDTLPAAPIKELSFLRVDCDMYESTMDVLIPLYPKLSRGGFCVIDDYGCVEACRLAVDEYREKHRINTRLNWIDRSGVYWQK